MSKPRDPIGHGFRLAYPLGLLLCVAWPLVLQCLLGSAIRPGSAVPGGVVQDLGYSFTGLTFASALWVAWRWRRVRGSFPRLPAERRGRVVVREVLLYSVLFGLSSVFGMLYYALGGPQAERFARGFVALTIVMFFVFVPRLPTWRAAAQGE